jgi:hypothetical protein
MFFFSKSRSHFIRTYINEKTVVLNTLTFSALRKKRNGMSFEFLKAVTAEHLRGLTSCNLLGVYCLSE